MPERIHEGHCEVRHAAAYNPQPDAPATKPAARLVDANGEDVEGDEDTGNGTRHLERAPWSGDVFPVALIHAPKSSTDEDASEEEQCRREPRPPLGVTREHKWKDERAGEKYESQESAPLAHRSIDLEHRIIDGDLAHPHGLDDPSCIVSAEYRLIGERLFQPLRSFSLMLQETRRRDGV
jgi:hypothetical protein